MIDAHPAPNGAITPLGSDSSKPERVKSPERTSGLAKKITTLGSSDPSSLETFYYFLVTTNFVC
jgi:hypothetical protein